ncbi:uncharacterized protein MELLADRAFT_78084 [Melampsora larici-populina 98AG31]|uniref:RWD domain-containing protein n=1 Tax=Melampsora larici-populina (strain 98AG31 / pathotype 3-4-7) TaxID=747676 RepID=F4RQM2_MELLP|nr:uncharacterized protein MELLADRAFT_78084 [Melampsora larici-populina 98AG31]EGG05323.1 hypothetical protein MELLADRAFT_78084 [Melampsora larici-populina 98AG31]
MDYQHTFPENDNEIESATNYQQTIEEWVTDLASEGREDLSLEISALAAIFGDQSIKISYKEDTNLNRETDRNQNQKSEESIRILVLNSFSSADRSTSLNEEIRFSTRVIIPKDYPERSPPQFQLISKYIGPYLILPELFNQISKLYQDEDDDWTSSQSILFDALESIKEIIMNYYHQKSKGLQESKVNREEMICKKHDEDHQINEVLNKRNLPISIDDQSTEVFEIFVSEPIMDRKSIFVGHSTFLKDPRQVKAIMNQILSDKKVARATHNMYAWKCEINGHLHQDNDDDGESAAGSRMQHLLNIMDVQNVLVCVSRWFGGIHLGSDRFKHINQATRDALIVGNFIKSSTLSNGESKSRSNHHHDKKKR